MDKLYQIIYHINYLRMGKVKIDNEGMSSIKKYRILYQLRKKNETRCEARQELISWEYHPMFQEVGQLLVKKHGPEWNIGIVAWFESQEN